MKALFDGDILVFRCGFAAERNTWFLKVGDQHFEFQYKKDADAKLDELLPGKHSRESGKDYQLWSERHVEPVENALYLVKNVINTALKEIDLSKWDTTVFLSGDKNFRYSVATTKPYKGNRDKAHRPTHEQAIKDFIRSNYSTVVADGIEADDEMGIRQTELGPNDSVIITLDKDLDMIPGLKYDFVQREPYSITDEQGWYNFHHQLLTGDFTDNIPGLPNIGKQKATKILAEVPHEDVAFHAYQAYSMHSPKDDWIGYLREQGKLLWIMRERGQEWEPDEDVIAEVMEDEGVARDTMESMY